MENTDVTEPHVNDPGRRRFLSFWAGALSAAVGAMLTVPLIGMFLGPLFVKRKELWLTLGKLSDVKPHAPTRFTYSFVKIDGWFEKTVHGSVYVVRESSGALVVLSNLCTHLGCGVRWDPEKSAFTCPCHNGVFSREGKVVSGPPPKPLNRFESRTSGDSIDILIEEA